MYFWRFSKKTEKIVKYAIFQQGWDLIENVGFWRELWHLKGFWLYFLEKKKNLRYRIFLTNIEKITSTHKWNFAIFENFWFFQKFHLWVYEIFSILVIKIRYLKFFFLSKLNNQKPFKRTNFHQNPTFSLISQPSWNIAYLAIFSNYLCFFLKMSKIYQNIAYFNWAEI